MAHYPDPTLVNAICISYSSKINNRYLMTRLYSTQLKASIYIYQDMTLGYRSLHVYIPTQQLLIVISVNSSFDSPENHLVDLVNQIVELNHTS